MAQVLRGLAAFQQAPRASPPALPPALAAIGRATVRDYGGTGRPVLFVPSLINPPRVLDLAEDRSLLRWLATRGVRPLLLDWGSPTSADRCVSVAGHVETLLLPLIDAVAATTGAMPVLAGYCLGGTMALAAARSRPAAGLVLIAAPWRFAGFPDEARTALAQLWESARPVADALGLLPMEVLQTGFWRLDPARTIDKFARFPDLDPGAAAAFVALEDWANEGPPLTAAAGRELIADMFGADLTGAGRWHVGGVAIDPAALGCPVLDIASATDRIVPAASAAAIGTRLTLAEGHVGMIVGRRARASLWEPLADWLSRPHLS